ncbi:MAG: hypothetical protein SFV54_27100 [Bryobacteraceae bacterium]|nr:hypothetical protein [Bryobacteraceae bacterium]
MFRYADVRAGPSVYAGAAVAGPGEAGAETGAEVVMSESRLLDALLEAWERNNEVLLNLLWLAGTEGLAARAMAGSPSVAEMFSHLHHERMVSVAEEAPEFAGKMPEGEWVAESDPQAIAALLRESGRVVRDAVAGRVAAGRELDLHFGHPALLLPFLIFHEGYHHGQIKLALKASGRPVGNDEAGPLTWDVWRRRW